MSDEVWVRSGVLGDLTYLTGLEQRCFDSNCLSERSWRRFLAHGSVMIAEVDSRPVAVAVILKRENSSILRLYSLAVDPEYRGRGIGRSLLSRLMSKAAEEGYTAVRLEVSIRNRAAMKLYTDAGFRVKSFLEGYYDSDGDAYRMERRL